MSANKFRLLMTGLCAFVPKRDITSHSNNNQMRVLLVESNNRADIGSADMTHTHEPHVPLFIVPLANIRCDDDYRQPDLKFIYEKIEWAVFYLEGEDLAIKGACEDRLEVIVEGGGGYGCPNHCGLNEKSFEWVANLEEISPGFADVDNACLGTNVDSSVCARVELWEGKICSAQLASLASLADKGSNYGSSDAILWKYKVPYSPKRGPNHCQAAAQIVEFETDFNCVIELVTKSFKRNPNLPADSAERNRTIGLIAEMKKPDIVAWVKNMPWADVLGRRTPEGYANMPDVHFSHLYKLLVDYEDVNVPHFQARCGSLVPLHQGNPNCQPVRTAPNDKA